MDDRGGLTLKTGKIGRVNCIRQQIMMPGETIDIQMDGNVRLESLRERDSLRINAHLGIFMTPLRWLWTDFPDYLKQGLDTNIAQPLVQVNNLDAYGVGAHDESLLNMPTYFRDSCLRIYNEWYKWPETADATEWHNDGNIAVPLQNAWSRTRFKADPDDANDRNVASATEFDVRQLAETQARFLSAIDRDVLSYNRYMELVQLMYGADGSREVDQVPFLVDEVDVGVNPRDMAATDGASLGRWQSIFDFNVDHSVRKVTTPEHCILTYMLTVRFSPLTETRHPLATDRLTWPELVGDHQILGSTPPKEVQQRDLFAGNLTNTIGYLPAGWQWRAGHDVVGQRIDLRDSFPYMKVPNTPEQSKDATRINQAFRSQSLGDYVVDIYTHERSRNRMNTSLESWYAGMKGRNTDAEFPHQGKMK